MSQPIHIELLSDDDDSLKTPVSKLHKRPRTDFQQTPFLIIDDSPIPQKTLTSASSTPSFVPDTPFSDLPKPQASFISRCTTKDVSAPKFSGVDRLICLESDDDAQGGVGRENGWKYIGSFAGFSEEDLESPNFSVNGKQSNNGATSFNLEAENCLEKNARVLDSTSYLDKVVKSNDHDEAGVGLGKESWLNIRLSFSDSDVEHDQNPKLVVEEKQFGNGTVNADFDLECLESSPTIVPSTYHLERCTSLRSSERTITEYFRTKKHNNVSLEDCTNQKLPFHDKDPDKENVRLEEEAPRICKPKSQGKANTQNKQNKTEKAANRKQSQEERKRLMEEKRRKKEEEKLRKEALKAEAAKSKQLEKARQRWEKEAEKYILAEIDTKVVQLGSIGGHLLTRFGEKGLRFNITSNPIEKSIVWRMTAPDELSQISSVRTDIPYVLLIYGDEEFCKVASDGSLMDRISSVRKHYPSHTICCLTNRLMSFINKREQEKYHNRKHASDWQRPPAEEVLAKLTTHFANVHSRQCADEAELAEHVVGLTINLAKCRFRKKLSPLSVYANGGHVPKDSVDRDLIMKNPWLKALVSIPKVQPRFAIAIFKRYPTMKSLLSVYFDPMKSVHEKEFLLKDLMTEGLHGNEDRRVGQICSKRVYRVLMAQNGSIKTDDVENGADYFRIQ